MNDQDKEVYYVSGKKPKRKNKSPEHDIQVRVINYLKSFPEVPLHSATVGGVRLAMHTARKMKEAGYSRGIPDLLIFEQNEEHIGLAIEIKTEKGRPSQYQREWIKNLRKRGWHAVICKGYVQCEQAINEYFNIDGPTSQDSPTLLSDSQ